MRPPPRLLIIIEYERGHRVASMYRSIGDDLSKAGRGQRRPRSSGPGPTEALASLILGQRDDGLAASDGAFRNRNAHDHPSQAFTVRPVRVFAHTKGDPFGATTHKF